MISIKNTINKCHCVLHRKQWVSKTWPEFQRKNNNNDDITAHHHSCAWCPERLPINPRSPDQIHSHYRPLTRTHHQLKTAFASCKSALMIFKYLYIYLYRYMIYVYLNIYTHSAFKQILISSNLTKEGNKPCCQAINHTFFARRVQTLLNDDRWPPYVVICVSEM